MKRCISGQADSVAAQREKREVEPELQAVGDTGVLARTADAFPGSRKVAADPIELPQWEKPPL